MLQFSGTGIADFADGNNAAEKERNTMGKFGSSKQEKIDSAAKEFR